MIKNFCSLAISALMIGLPVSARAQNNELRAAISYLNSSPAAGTSMKGLVISAAGFALQVAGLVDLSRPKGIHGSVPVVEPVSAANIERFVEDIRVLRADQAELAAEEMVRRFKVGAFGPNALVAGTVLSLVGSMVFVINQAQTMGLNTSAAEAENLTRLRSFLELPELKQLEQAEQDPELAQFLIDMANFVKARLGAPRTPPLHPGIRNS